MSGIINGSCLHYPKLLTLNIFILLYYLLILFVLAEAAAAEVRDPGEAGEDAKGCQPEGQGYGAGETGRTGQKYSII